MAKKENKNKSFILRIDSDTMDAVEKWAADEFRSINGQLQWIISEALRKNGRLKNRKLQLVEEDKPDANPEDPTTLASYVFADG